ncbi:MAG TPA: twin-arginine translocation signal domain-containing protein, partial [Kineobactrum sp.]
MSNKSLGDPYDRDVSLIHPRGCDCGQCPNHTAAHNAPAVEATAPQTRDEMMDRAVENAIVRGMFKQNDFSRRQFLGAVGGGTLAAALASILPIDKVKAAVKDSIGALEKTRLTVGFVPITCATPIIMAHPMGFY